MLSVQHSTKRPAMGSGQPPLGGNTLPFGCESSPRTASFSRQDRELTFTYTTDQTMGPPNHDPSSDEAWFFNNFLAHAPAPAPGDPILTSAETNDIGLMLNDMVSNNFAGHDFGNHFTSDDWTNGPPHLVNLSTSYGQLADGLSPSAFYADVQPQNSTSTGSSMLPTSASTVVPGSYVESDPILPTAPGTNTATTDPTLSTAPPISGTPTIFAPVVPIPDQHSPTHQHAIEQPQATEDVLHAAASLIQTGYHGRSHSMQSGPSFSHVSQRPTNSTMGPPVGHLRHQGLDEFVQEGRRLSQSADQTDQHATFKYWISGKPSSDIHTAQKPAPIPLQYGTDQNFSNSNQPFIPRSEKDTAESIHKDQLRYMKCVELSPDADRLSPSSPVFNGNNLPPLNLKTRGPSTSLNIEPNGDYRNWRRSRSGGDDEDDEADEPQSAVSKTSGRKRKAKLDSSNSPTAADLGPMGAGKRRKSSAAVKRENLTEDQKRENHINSEKKRRKVIQTGFDNLGHLVPSLKGGNPSKSAMLESTVIFLQELLAGNDKLNTQLRQL